MPALIEEVLYNTGTGSTVQPGNIYHYLAKVQVMLSTAGTGITVHPRYM